MYKRKYAAPFSEGSFALDAEAPQIVNAEDDVSPSEERKSEIRVDFVRRLFAVAVSVGAASKLSQIFAVGNKDPVTSILLEHSREFSLLFISVVAVVLSWEGYLISVRRVPIEEPPRFYLDVLIVFAYLALMEMVSRYHAWFVVISGIFVLYTIWDALTITACIRQNVVEDGKRPWWHGLVITVAWTIAMILISFLQRDLDNDWSFALSALGAFAVVVLYRMDKRFKLTWLVRAPLLLTSVLFAFAGRLV